MNNVAADYVFMLVAAVHPLIRISQVSKPTQLVLVDVPVSELVVEPADPPARPPPPTPPPRPSTESIPAQPLAGSRRPSQPSEPPWWWNNDLQEDDMAWCWARPKDVWRSGNHGGDVA